MADTLHIISFDIPYPPNYGGVIDVYYKLQALHKQGVEIILHCFEYRRQHADELNRYCKKVFYYKRDVSWKRQLSIIPYVVLSRKNNDLINNLLKDEHPILFEALHTCYYLNDKRLARRIKIYRASNIEHHYYWHLFKSEKKSLAKSFFYLLESIKLYNFQKRLKYADVSLMVSQKDCDYLQKKIPNNDVRYMPSFQEHNVVSSLTGKGGYALYHGNLSVVENEKAALYLVEKAYGGSDIPVIIAGLNPGKKLTEAVNKFSNIQLIASPSHDEMNRLIEEAHINVLITFQPTGLKLKLLNVLFSGRFCLVNGMMLAGTGLDSLCVVSEIAFEELQKNARILFEKDFTPEEIGKRSKLLSINYSNDVNAKKIINIIS
ncbi:MAG: glycosyltransferase family 1 protein [Bacteroidales bacterium]|jgi:hypothetical protein|nr:glycosyltransferase family 1 protein [Bacteroidales bacterium]